MKTFSFTLAILLLLLGCNRDEESYDTSNPILVLIYLNNYYYLVGFFHELIDSGYIYYENTVSIKPVDVREDF